MKITELTTYIVNVGGHRNWTYVRIDTDEGIHGIGEAFCIGPDKATVECIRYFGEWLKGMDPMDTEMIQEKILRWSRFPSGTLIWSAASAIDIACWDIKGKALNMPVYKLLGGAVRDKVWVYCHAMGKTVEEAGDVLEAKIEKYGYNAFKGGLGMLGSRPYAGDIRNMSRFFHYFRDRFGEDLEIGTDMQSKIWEPYHALEIAEAVKDARPFFLEEPILPEHFEDMRRLRDRAGVPIATGEQIYRMHDWYEFIKLEAADILQPDPLLCGGFTGMMKISAMSAATNMRISPHNPLSAVQNACNVHLGMAMPNFLILEHEPRDKGAVADMVTDVFETKDGYTRPNDKPGLGIDFDYDYLKSMDPYVEWSRAHRGGSSGTYDHDGSVHVM